MTRKTSGPGWAFIPDKEAAPASTSAGASASPQPKIRLEKRQGKKVTVIAGLHTYGTDRLNEIARTLKTMCGAGGTVKNGAIEIQGDKVAQVQGWFKATIK